ncbi:MULTISPECIES: alcohol dehydrogenase catalytic domain-containing protein [unclassified Haladaptatus]|uniref:zinc-dependent alcohol dehydrogenase n=1 Tax=unclassified Haladaptatus TaxID=2622732 RepID=UPI00209BF7C2|nr:MULTISPECIES: alcohol dehydrogenase catalytic domain-containing protein [unclassified Haladaptatus]MCO8244914.1 alcohol dehydrogenase catalytic domain-containing protein [Haladaptatus sp. AB643]MCO8255573.1 alcohol dehydrogenase catalytic domain-containing protein [Haladaptatus sp. AB618]
MQAIVQTGAETVEVQDREKPSPNADEVLIRVHTAGICGSDAHAYKYDGGYEWIPIPRIMGHEYSGTVEAVGADVTSFSQGDKIVEEPIHHCGKCFQCKNGQTNVCQDFSITGMHRDGAYRNYVTVEPQHLHRVPDGVPLDEAALTEPTSIAARAVLTQSDLRPGESVLVQGPGPIGVLTAAVADSIGADVVVSGLDKDTQYRLPLVEELGIDTVNAQNTDVESLVDERTIGGGFDVIFDATGHHSGVETGVELVRKGGQIVMVGIPNGPSTVAFTDSVRGEVDVNTSYGSTWRNFEQALRLIENGSVDASTIMDTSFSTSDPSRAFEAFLHSETCKPVFSFAN